MSKFDIFTKYIPMIQADSIGEWVIGKENDGTLLDFFKSGCILKWLERLNSIE
ncbi:MAG TPA: hypothetical protein VEG39_16425 [Clostridia bacterium]|nr:hypothetical protein [Clostridia bacterium]